MNFLQVWDVTVSDLLAGHSLAAFRGLIFPGGFSYADVLGSAKGWAGALRFHPSAAAQLDAFFKRPDTFSLGVCNGCQLMALLGWSGKGVALRTNLSERFEARIFYYSIFLHAPFFLPKKLKINICSFSEPIFSRSS